jgi:uncharacterized membrane protein YcaP (DUF421 family)
MLEHPWTSAFISSLIIFPLILLLVWLLGEGGAAEAAPFAAVYSVVFGCVNGTVQALRARKRSR